MQVMYSQVETTNGSTDSKSSVRRKTSKSRSRRKATASSTSAAAAAATSSSNRLYKAPQATIRTSKNQTKGYHPHQQPIYYPSNIGGVLLDDNVGVKSGTRRRRRTSHTGGNIPSSSVHDGTRLDTAPSVVERQDSDGSLGAMALAVAAERDQYVDVDLIPPAPMLWADNDVGTTSNHQYLHHHQHHRNHHSVHSPHMSKRKGMVPPEMAGYVHHRISPKTGGSTATMKKKKAKKKERGNGAISKNSSGNRVLHYGHEDFSENGLDDSFAGCDFAGSSDHSNSHSHHDERKSNGGTWKNSLLGWWPFWRMIRSKSLPSHHHNFSWVHLAQVSILLILAIYVYDSHSKVQSHKNQLREYDEERSHILEQMMWIDKAAKKVHKKYTEKELLAAALGDDPPSKIEHPNNEEEDGGEGSDNHKIDQRMEIYQQALKEAQSDLELLHHTIQLNARQHLAATFGDLPAEVSLQVTDDSSILIGLSDDTPHAISTLIQQVNRHLWDEVQVMPYTELASGTNDNENTFLGRLQLIAKPSDLTTPASPLLEFIERSHGCREVGSVSLRQQEQAMAAPVGGRNDDVAGADVENQFILVLTVNLDPQDQALPKGEVCIGSVSEGLDTLVRLHKEQQQLKK